MKKILALFLFSFSVQAGVTLDWEINILEKINIYESEFYSDVYMRIFKLNNNNALIQASLLNPSAEKVFILNGEDGSIIDSFDVEYGFSQLTLFSEGNFAYMFNEVTIIHFINENGLYETLRITNNNLVFDGGAIYQQGVSDVLYTYSETTNGYASALYKYTITSDNSSPVLNAQTSSGFSQDNFVLNWDSSSGTEYQIQSSTDLTNWVNIGSAIVGTGESMTWANHVTNSQAFYRVVED
tara:strand:- start:70 stop:789 length:720 start_codon:yes stop_codon:yes gene_type:complete